MRLSSSPSSSSFQRLLLKRGSVASVVAVLACTCMMLVPMAAGVKEPDIDLKTANHDHSQAHAITMDVKHARMTEHSREHDVEFPKKNKPNKSYAKKYVDGNQDGFHHAKQKKSIYEKKYFDYLPAEPKGPLETSAADASLMKRTNSRRLRRDTDAAEEQTRVKRQGYMYTYPRIPMIIQPGSLLLQYNPHHRPQLNNHYLPPDRTYLPPYSPRPTPADQPGTFELDNRFGGRPFFAFDTVYDPSVETNYVLQPGPRPRPSGGQFPNSFQGPGFSASRPAAPTTTVRPLPPPASTTSSSPSTITTTTPRPVIQNNSDDDFDWAALGLSPDAVGTRLGGDNGNNNDNRLNPQARAAPSKCTWAIANCCSQYSDNIRYYCFEQNQCYGAFWGDNVCRTYYKLALTEIENYYNVQ